MSRQFSVYLLNPDLDDLSGWLRRLGARFLVGSARSIDSLGELERLQELTAYLAREQDVGDLAFRTLGHGPSTILDEQRSPVIEFSRSVLHAGRLGRGRFYVVTRYWSPGGERTEKPQEFLAWADRVFRTVKLRLRYVHSLGAYCGAEAAELLGRVPDAARRH